MHSLSLTALGLPPCFRWEGRAGGAAPPPETPDTALPWPATRLGSVSRLYLVAFQTGGGSFRAVLGWSWGSNTYHTTQAARRQQGQAGASALCCPPSLSTRGLTAARGDEAPAASPMLSRPSRGEPGALLQSWPLLGAGAAPPGPNLCAL